MCVCVYDHYGNPLGLVTRYDHSSFINAHQRFLARQGPVRSFYTDNGSNFVGAERILREEIKTWNQGEIQEYLRQHDITWTFNPPTASHMGGLWEGLIRTIQRIPLAVMPNKGRGINYNGLTTVFCAVEAVVKTRPLTDVSLEIGEDLPLTPNHLLRVNPQIALPPIFSHEKDCYA